MSEPLKPSVGLAVVHLFAKIGVLSDREGIEKAVSALTADEGQVIPVAMLGHKADVAFMALSSDQWRLRSFQTDLVGAGLEIVDSYVSLTEVSEYAADVTQEMRNMRLYPQLPPEDKRAWCFYPMSKRRNVDQNWFTLGFDKRKELMYEHGRSGRKFAGRVLQVITGSTGIDDYEWGVTLFCVHPDDLKEVVYTMRYDEASAEYAEFGTFYTGIVDELGVVLNRCGLAV